MLIIYAKFKKKMDTNKNIIALICMHLKNVYYVDFNICKQVH